MRDAFASRRPLTHPRLLQEHLMIAAGSEADLTKMRGARAKRTGPAKATVASDDVGPPHYPRRNLLIKLPS